MANARKLWPLAALLVLMAVPVAALVRGAAPPELPVIAELPPFELEDHHGERFAREDLLGRVWVTNFIYTSCGGVCPTLTAKMRSIQDRLREAGRPSAIGLLSITVDPKNDTAARLAEYAERWKAEEGRWIFATGEPAAVQDAVVRGFRTVMEPPAGEGGPTDFEIVHGERLVLVDGQGRIRGYFAADEAGLDAVVRSALALARVEGG